MKEVFADASFLIALVSVDDALHQAALGSAHAVTGRMVTTDWVLAEVGASLSTPPGRDRFAVLVAEVRASPTSMVLEATRAQFDAGMHLFISRPDQSWSLTDCISFAVMRRRGIREALTADRHFVQAGFRALML